MRFDIDLIVPIIMVILMCLLLIALIFVVITSGDKETELCNENSLEYLGSIKDVNGYYDYCGELKNGILVKKYRIINSKYLEDES